MQATAMAVGVEMCCDFSLTWHLPRWMNGVAVVATPMAAVLPLRTSALAPVPEHGGHHQRARRLGLTTSESKLNSNCKMCQH